LEDIRPVLVLFSGARQVVMTCDFEGGRFETVEFC